MKRKSFILIEKLGDCMEEYSKVENIHQAISFLKENVILVSFDKNDKKHFIQKDGKVMVIEANCRYLLPFLQFEELFQSFVFYVENPQKEVLFDFSRDDEYYRWKHK